ncbi:uncharacterized protein EHS24_007143 [Apiotrichum porosum]|uniref:Uncharacterized protein n=1 Tax=Apiotrichum porosum TaxID=105984 RepID=A0A427XX52_9TREE|nr:uncharacterized protein EHS24_007143 [Apiotrichum porosum]RSH83458.1 hypothetical protein EHS24_007143 [Apiotrichum porosum]
MPPPDAPSPTPSNATGGKRARSTASVAPAAQPAARTKRRKPEDSNPDSGAEGQRRPMSFGVGMVKGREDEWSEPADIKTKINFLDLPLEALYKYLELHDLVPRWDVSPWSEQSCTPPNALYTIPPPPPVVPIHPPSPKAHEPMEVEAGPVPVENEVKPEQGDEDARPKPEGEATEGNEGGDEEGKEGDDETLAPPTTRSKTAPFRRPSTPEPTPPPTIKRGVFTLSDVHAARAVLAEKANQHWMKGLGGGQNREGETIVNFLYKNKVGHGRLLRVYNPTPAPFS